MKKKDLLLVWERTQRKFYAYLDRDELERDYMEWFKQYDNVSDSMFEYPYMEKSQMIDELIEDELEYRKDDEVYELKETIEHIKSLSRI